MVKGIFVNHELLVLIAVNCEITFPFLVKRDFGDLFFLLKRKMPNSLSVKCETANLFSMKSDQYPPPPLYRPQRTNINRPIPFVIQSGGSRGGARGGPAPPLFLDQTEARRAEKFFWQTGPPSLCQGLDYWAPPLSEGLDPPLIQTSQNTCKTL